MNTELTDGAAPLLERLRESGFFQHYGLLGDGNLRSYEWEKMSAKLTGDTQWLWRFSCWGEGHQGGGHAGPGRASGAVSDRPQVGASGRGEVDAGASVSGQLCRLPFFVDQRAATQAYFGMM